MVVHNMKLIYKYKLRLTPNDLLVCFFFFNDTATTEIYTLSLHDALPISPARGGRRDGAAGRSGPRPLGGAAWSRPEDAPPPHRSGLAAGGAQNGWGDGGAERPLAPRGAGSASSHCASRLPGAG